MVMIQWQKMNTIHLEAALKYLIFKKHYEAKDIYITEIKNFNLAERMIFFSKDQDKFIEGVGIFENYIRLRTSDKDKVLLSICLFLID